MIDLAELDVNLSILVLNLLRVTTVIEGTEQTNLPEYYLVEVSKVSSASEPESRKCA